MINMFWDRRNVLGLLYPALIEWMVLVIADGKNHILVKIACSWVETLCSWVKISSEPTLEHSGLTAQPQSIQVLWGLRQAPEFLYFYQ